MSELAHKSIESLFRSKQFSVVCMSFIRSHLPGGNLVPRACDPREETRGSGIIRCRKPGILAKIELRIHFNGQSDSSLKRIIPEPHDINYFADLRMTFRQNFFLQDWFRNKFVVGLG
jgi:hypothetical protein